MSTSSLWSLSFTATTSIIATNHTQNSSDTLLSQQTAADSSVSPSFLYINQSKLQQHNNSESDDVINNSTTTTVVIHTLQQTLANNNNNNISSSRLIDTTIITPHTAFENNSSFSSFINSIPIVIVVRVVGESANWLRYLLKAKALQYQLERNHRIQSTLRIRTKRYFRRKRPCIRFLTTCFPNLDLNRKAFNDDLDLPPHWRQAQGALHQWNNDIQTRLYDNNNSTTETFPFLSPHLFQYPWSKGLEPEEHDYTPFQQLLERNIINITRTGPFELTLPFIYIEDFGTLEEMNLYWNEFHHFLAFDDNNPSCCALRPDPDMVVFHLRGFALEIDPERIRTGGLQEVHANHTVDLLFPHLVNNNNNEQQYNDTTDNNNEQLPNNNNKLALLSRHDRDRVGDWIDALSARGINVTFVHQSHEQDWCYLKKAQRELVGTWESTYVQMAAYLADYTPQIRLYCINSTINRQMGNQTGLAIGCQFATEQQHENWKPVVISYEYDSFGNPL